MTSRHLRWALALVFLLMLLVAVLHQEPVCARIERRTIPASASASGRAYSVDVCLAWAYPWIWQPRPEPILEGGTQ